MFKKLKRIAFVLCAAFTGMIGVVTPAFAEITPGDPKQLSEKIIKLVQDVGMPVGGALLFLAICVGGIELMLSRGKPEKRAETMSGLLYIAIGGIILGGALFFAGVFLGIGKNIFGQ
ncbi:MAG: hypothetical protein HPY89_11115 [Pelotomaculum sp.]|nr:hypothetical protein [Pelotomaculum sp.]